MTEKREKILQTTAELFVSEGLNVPTARIAKESGVSNGTLFNNFPTKQNLIDQLYLSVKEELAREILSELVYEDPTKDVLSILWERYIKWAVENTLKHHVCHLLMNSNMLSPEVVEELDRVFDVIYRVLERSINEGEIKNIPLEFLSLLGQANTSAAVMYALEEGIEGKALDDHIQTAFTIYWDGIKK